MKIDINSIPIEGLTLIEKINPSDLDLETDLIKYQGLINARAFITKISNAVSVDLNLTGKIHAVCARCLEEFEIDLNRELKFNYPVSKTESKIDLDPDIREEIIVGYPIKFLCKENCLGLCVKCGKNLNEGGCSCGTT
ncbi:MAG: DUF177 domain-containing protein [Candidatus Omnitrophica bacterium]|nr:DUF177 domain-containing protein [Candidatus Omnitrophota bacterium]